MQRSREEKVFGEIRLARPAHAESLAPVAELTRVNCPLCMCTVTVPNDQEPSALACSICGMTFPFVPRHDAEEEPPRGPLENWLAGRPLQPRSLNAWERFRRWCGERPYLVRTTVAMLLVLSLVSWLSVSAYRNACARLYEANQQLEQWQRQSEESPATAARDKPTTDTVAQPADPPVAVVAENKPAKKTTAQPANPPVAAAPAAKSSPAQDLSLPALESAQRDAPLR